MEAPQRIYAAALAITIINIKDNSASIYKPDKTIPAIANPIPPTLGLRLAEAQPIDEKINSNKANNTNKKPKSDNTKPATAKPLVFLI